MQSIVIGTIIIKEAYDIKGETRQYDEVIV